MAWTYSDWRTYPNGASRLERLRLHMAELSDAVTLGVSADGQSVSSSDVRQMLADLESVEEKLSALYDSPVEDNPGRTHRVHMNLRRMGR